MIEKYFERQHAIRRLRSGCTGPHIDASAGALWASGHSRSSGRALLRGVARFGRWMDDKEVDLCGLDALCANIRETLIPERLG